MISYGFNGGERSRGTEVLVTNGVHFVGHLSTKSREKSGHAGNIADNVEAGWRP